MKATEPHSIRSVTGDLRQLGVRGGDTVMIHASLRRIGPIEGRAGGLLRALDRAVGRRGTLVMILGARDDHAWVNELPEDQREARLADAVPFDALETPVHHEMGSLAEVFRTRPGTRVSDHPEGRFAVRGHGAVAMLADLPWNDYYGPDSVLDRLVQRDGKVLRMGANPDTTTLLHHAEYLADLPVKRRARRYRRVRTAGGAEIRVVDCLDDEHGIVDYPDEDYFAAILRAFLAAGRARTGTVGSAASELIRARDIVPFGVAWMNEHLARVAR